MDWLKNQRIISGMTGEQVGTAVGVSQQYYNFIENGKRRPSVEVAKRIAAVLGFEWTRFFEDGGVTPSDRAGGPASSLAEGAKGAKGA